MTINGMSKTYSVTGWRVGWAVGPEKITNAIRKVHDFLTVGAPAPLQEAGAAALSLPAEYYAKLGGRIPGAAGSFDSGAGGGGVSVFSSAGSLLRDDGYFRRLDLPMMSSFVKYLVKDIGVAAVPGSSFYRDARDGARQVRFAFCKKLETLDAAAEKLAKLRAKVV